jgi:hypothetical protein
MRLRTAEGVLVPGLFAYAADQFGDEFFDAHSTHRDHLVHAIVITRSGAS